jgi:hypothetical protein
MAKSKEALSRHGQAQADFDAAKGPTLRRRISPGVCNTIETVELPDGRSASVECGQDRTEAMEERKGIAVHVSATCPKGHEVDRYGYAAEPLTDEQVAADWIEVAS